MHGRRIGWKGAAIGAGAAAGALVLAAAVLAPRGGEPRTSVAGRSSTTTTDSEEPSASTSTTGTPTNGTSTTVTASTTSTGPRPGGRTTTTAARPSATTTTTAPSRPEMDGVTYGYWVVGTDGTGLRRISTDGVLMSWSPTGDRVALATSDWIWKLPTDQTRPAAVVASASDRMPLCMDWSPTGDLTWVSHRGQLINAVDGDAYGATLAEGFGNAARCRWSPDGKTLAVARLSSISLVDRTGRVLFDWPVQANGAEPYSTTWLEWSTDGRRLAYIGRVGDDPRNPRWGLYVAGADGRVPTAPTFLPDGTDVHHLSWSRQRPDDIYVQAGRDSGSTQYVVDVSTGEARLLAQPGCCQRLDSLSGGGFVASAPSKNGWRKELVVLGPDRVVVRRLAFGRPPDPNGSVMTECNGAYLPDKRVSPDGRSVVFFVGQAYGPRCDSPVF
jgi:hypothetical protein